MNTDKHRWSRRIIAAGLAAGIGLAQAHPHGEQLKAVDEWVAKAGPEGKALLDGRR